MLWHVPWELPPLGAVSKDLSYPRFPPAARFFCNQPLYMGIQGVLARSERFYRGPDQSTTSRSTSNSETLAASGGCCRQREPWCRYCRLWFVLVNEPGQDGRRQDGGDKMMSGDKMGGDKGGK
jgi:hypothetical protein